MACSIIVGAVFVLSALLKAISFVEFAVQVSYYGIVRDPLLIRMMATVLIGVEAVLGVGVLFCARFRRHLLLLALVLLTGFSVAIGYAWVFRDIENCGCFGKYLQTGPIASLAKNAVLGVLAAVALRHIPAGSHPAGLWKPSLAAGAGILVVSIAVHQNSAFRQDATPPGKFFPDSMPGASPPTLSRFRGGAPAGQSLTWQANTYDLSEGAYLVAMLSDSCEECEAIIPGLNEYAQNPDVPHVVAFVLSDDPNLDGFREEYRPRFPTQAMSPLEFFQHIGDAPPRFILIKDGHRLEFWDKKLPPQAAILEAALRASP